MSAASPREPNRHRAYATAARLRTNLSVVASAYNILSECGESYYYTDNTPDYARRRGYNSYGVQCTVGLKGQF